MFKPVPRALLIVGWVLVVVAICISLSRHDVVLAIAFCAAGIIGTVAQLRRPPRQRITWGRAKKIASRTEPAPQEIDPARPLVGMVLHGPGEGRYVWFATNRHTDQSTWILGPASGDGLGLRQYADSRRADPVELASAIVGYLPQGAFSDEIWRRNFHSLRGGDHYRGLAAR